MIRLAGEVRVEQKKRQTVKAIPVSTQQEGWLARRKRARAFAKSRRKGAFGLAKKIKSRRKGAFGLAKKIMERKA